LVDYCRINADVLPETRFQTKELNFVKTIDLHTHTTASDGSYSPIKLVEYAVEKGLSAVAITDHDTMRGIREAQEHIRKSELDLQLIPGMEISTHYRSCPYGIHVLAYFIDKTDPELEATIEGIESELSYGMSPQDAIAVIHSNGGIAVMAHPKDCFMPMSQIGKLVEELASAGLDGIECLYTTHSEAETEQFLEMASRLNLCVTGGTDFHGTGKPGVDLGSGHGALQVPDELVSVLRQKAASAA
jgi:3',5'-nucleoside bisphosphate phosphatase